MSKFTSQVAAIIRRKFEDASAGTMGRARLGRVGIPEANVAKFCHDISASLGVYEIMVTIGGSSAPTKAYAFDTAKGEQVIFGIASPRIKEMGRNAPPAMISEGFAATLRDARSNRSSPIYDSKLMFFVEREIDTLRTSLDLTAPDEVLSGHNIFSTIAEDAQSEKAQVFIKSAASFLGEVASRGGPEGHVRVLDALTDIASEPNPNIGARLPEIMEGMNDSDLDNFLETKRTPKTIRERLENNRRAADIVREARDASTDATLILEDHVRPETIDRWSKIPPEKADFRKWLADKKPKGRSQTKWDRFRFRKGMPTMQDEKLRIIEIIVQVASGYKITSQYASLPPGPTKIRLFRNGKLEHSGDPDGTIVASQGTELTFNVPSASDCWQFFQVDIMAGKPTARGKAHSTIRTAVPPSGTPRFLIPHFSIDATNEGCFEIDLAREALILPDGSQTLAEGDFSLAIEPNVQTPLPARITSGSDEVAQWRFSAEDQIFSVPLRCIATESLEPTRTAPFRSALHLILAGEGAVSFWEYDDQMQQLWARNENLNRGIPAQAKGLLAKERQIVDDHIICPTLTAGGLLERHDPPWDLEDHPFVQGVVSRYKGLLDWLREHHTLPSLVGDSQEYWAMVEDLVNWIQTALDADVLDSEKLGAWLYRVGAVVDDTTATLRWTTPLWPPHMAHALAMRRACTQGSVPKQRLASITAEGLVPCALQSAVSAPSKRVVPRREALASWLRWVPVSEFVDDDISSIKTIVHKRLSQFMAAFPQLVGYHPDAAITIRFVGVAPTQQVVEGLEAFLEETHAKALADDSKLPVLQIRAEFYMEDPSKSTVLDSRMGPDAEARQLIEGRDLLQASLTYAKRSVRKLAQERDSPRRYAHITFIAQGFNRQPGTATHMEYRASARISGTSPAAPTRLTDLASGKNDAIVFGSHDLLNDTPDPAARFAASWNELQGSLAEALPHASRNRGIVPLVHTPPKARFALDWIYPDSLWVVHLEPGVSLIPLTRELQQRANSGDNQVLIHFTDQLNPSTLGFDEVTLTYRASTFRQCLDSLCEEINIPHDPKLLKILNTVNPRWTLRLVASRGTMHNRLDVLACTLSGTYALSQARKIQPEYTWLIAGWEDFVRNTGATGLAISDGLLGKGRGTDDAVLFGLRKGDPARIRILLVESKYRSANWREGIEQVRATAKVLDALQESGDELVKRITLAELGRYIFRVAERMYVHDLLEFEQLAVIDDAQDHLLEGAFRLTMPSDEALPEKGFVIQVDPDAFEGRKLKQTDGIVAVSIPWAGIASMSEQLSLEHLVEVDNDVEENSAQPIESKPHITRTAETVIAEKMVARPESSSAATSDVQSPPKREPSIPEIVSDNQVNDEPAASRGWSQAVLNRLQSAPYRPPNVDLDKFLRIDDVLHGLKIEVEPPEEADIVVGPQAVLVHLRLSRGAKVANIERILRTLKVNLGISQDPSISTNERAGYVTLFLPLEDRVPIPLLSFVAAEDLESRILPVPAGLRGDNGMKWLDLLQTNHLLVAGSTGSGKTVYLQGLVMSAALALPPDRLEISIIDPKMLDFVGLADLPHLNGNPIVYQSEEAFSFLEDIVDEIQERQRTLVAAKCKNIAAYHKRFPESSMPYRLVVVDEYNQLRLSMPKGRERDLENVICRIAQIGRAFGVYLVVATQRPSADVVSGDIKANFPTRVSFRLPTHTDSQVILDAKGAEMLMPHGDGIVAGHGGLVRFQALYVDDEDIERFVDGVKTVWTSMARQ